MFDLFCICFGFGVEIFPGFPGVRKEHPASAVIAFFLLWQHPQHVAVLENIYSAFTNDAFSFQEHPACNSVTSVHIEGHSNKLKMLVRYRISEKKKW